MSDGVQVLIHLLDDEFDGVLYVKGRSKDEQCRRVVSISSETMHKTEIFKVAFGNCGLIHVNVSFLLKKNLNSLDSPANDVTNSRCRFICTYILNLYLEHAGIYIIQSHPLPMLLGTSQFRIGHTKTPKIDDI